ncbi:hypothetical protein [Arenibacter sp. S6351L]|uniref:hypothetical protein n=1 Tax=Arenibacter sp. S6351L TaxID=2926407 RepID=UPI001FF6DC32|nr:hypothetical protein [Arenibacter sp. S6351L]MCK0136483.1 hypothetical protein [Arenibacter sp. S6351L]
MIKDRDLQDFFSDLQGFQNLVGLDEVFCEILRMIIFVNETYKVLKTLQVLV